GPLRHSPRVSTAKRGCLSIELSAYSATRRLGMASLLGSFTQLMTPDTIGKLSRAVGVDTNQAQKGLDVIRPLMLGSLAKKSETVSCMKSIIRMRPGDTGTRLLGKVLRAAGQAGAISSASLLSG